MFLLRQPNILVSSLRQHLIKATSSFHHKVFIVGIMQRRPLYIDRLHPQLSSRRSVLQSIRLRRTFSYERNCVYGKQCLTDRALVFKSRAFSKSSTQMVRSEKNEHLDHGKNLEVSNESRESDGLKDENMARGEDYGKYEEIETGIDVDKELLRYDYEEFELKDDIQSPEPKQRPKKTATFELKRGQSGVFDLDELVNLLKKDNARDICTIRIPHEYHYVDFMVFATGRSTRHLRAMAEYIKWAYKQKRSEHDPSSVKVEGELTNDWFAVDLGNIAVHLLLEETRRAYDLEQLWTVGAEFDEQTRAQSFSVLGGATTLEDFSFDVELEKFRKIREEESEKEGNEHGEQSPKSDRYDKRKQLTT